MSSYGFLWFLMVPYNWFHMISYKFLWFLMISHDSYDQHVIFYDCQWLHMISYDSIWFHQVEMLSRRDKMAHNQNPLGGLTECTCGRQHNVMCYLLCFPKALGNPGPWGIPWEAPFGIPCILGNHQKSYEIDRQSYWYAQFRSAMQTESTYGRQANRKQVLHMR